MTIRENPPSSPSPAEDDQITTEPSIDRTTSPTTSHTMTDGADDDPTSPPVIEIIDDDDEDELPANFTVQLNAEVHFSRFPYCIRFENALDALREIINHVQKSKSDLSRNPFTFTYAA